MNTLIELVLRLAGLVEAEGRAAKQNAVRVAAAVCMWVMATLLVTVSLLGLAAAIFLAFLRVLPPSLSILIVAGIVLVFAAGAAVAGQVVLKRHSHRKTVALRP